MNNYTRLSSKFQIGKAGEHFVCADLILKGFAVSMAEEALPYDILLDIGHKIIKIQVKTTETYKLTNQWKGRTEAYIISVKRKGSNGLKRYQTNEIDIFAVVTLDTKQVGYIMNGEMPTTINIRPDKFKGLYHDEKGVLNHKIITDLKKEGKSIKEAMEVTGLGETSIRNSYKKDCVPFQTKALYMSDLQREREWFL